MESRITNDGPWCFTTRDQKKPELGFFFPFSSNEKGLSLCLHS